MSCILYNIKCWNDLSLAMANCVTTTLILFQQSHFTFATFSVVQLVCASQCGMILVHQTRHEILLLFFKHRSFIHKSHSTFAVYGNLNISFFLFEIQWRFFLSGKFHRWVSTSHSIYGMKKTKFMVAMFIDCNRSISRLLTASPYSS